ncbi:helix-turn-helix domain-containing protein [Micrococcus terreus]|uniref:Helix-turn-helix domain-containing protein n=1 Tax=Micrococcus terreus TaxID=574650 RepID=A0A1I7MSC8_9MICC|nr:helix-turn-helix domain-containing protein [Micrococcus terreus]MCT2089853.1 helix-turn-helix domain-containing protein [Micrococcus terreus]SFV24811.1 Helix-turn-helix domain-containing protein [Micrococcus terreus]
MSNEAMNWARKCGATGTLRPGEVLVLMLMADHADEQWSCYPTATKLALDSNQSERTITSQLKRLRELGLISVENLYGQGRGRIGVRYYLHETALDRFAGAPENDSPAEIAGRENTRDANIAPESGNPGNMRDADFAPESGNRENTRGANIADESLRRNLTHDSGANPGGAHLKERARINHQKNHHHHLVEIRGGAEVGPGAGADEDDDLIHRGVDLAQLFELVPDLATQVEAEHVRAVVDVVLDRAGDRRVKHPTRYVASALTADLDGVLIDAAIAWQARPVAPRGAAQAQPGVVPVARERWQEPVPCTNPDHRGAYDGSGQDCHQCRLEARLVAQEPADVDQVQWSPERLDALPESLRKRVLEHLST